MIVPTRWTLESKKNFVKTNVDSKISKLRLLLQHWENVNLNDSNIIEELFSEASNTGDAFSDFEKIHFKNHLKSAEPNQGTLQRHNHGEIDRRYITGTPPYLNMNGITPPPFVNPNMMSPKLHYFAPMMPGEEIDPARIHFHTVFPPSIFIQLPPVLIKPPPGFHPDTPPLMVQVPKCMIQMSSYVVQVPFQLFGSTRKIDLIDCDQGNFNMLKTFHSYRYQNPFEFSQMSAPPQNYPMRRASHHGVPTKTEVAQPQSTITMTPESTVEEASAQPSPQTESLVEDDETLSEPTEVGESTEVVAASATEIETSQDQAEITLTSESTVDKVSDQSNPKEESLVDDDKPSFESTNNNNEKASNDINVIPKTESNAPKSDKMLIDKCGDTKVKKSDKASSFEKPTLDKSNMSSAVKPVKTSMSKTKSYASVVSKDFEKMKKPEKVVENNLADHSTEPHDEWIVPKTKKHSSVSPQIKIDTSSISIVHQLKMDENIVEESEPPVQDINSVKVEQSCEEVVDNDALQSNNETDSEKEAKKERKRIAKKNKRKRIAEENKKIKKEMKKLEREQKEKERLERKEAAAKCLDEVEKATNIEETRYLLAVSQIQTFDLKTNYEQCTLYFSECFKLKRPTLLKKTLEKTKALKEKLERYLNLAIYLKNFEKSEDYVPIERRTFEINFVKINDRDHPLYLEQIRLLVEQEKFAERIDIHICDKFQFGRDFIQKRIQDFGEIIPENQMVQYDVLIKLEKFFNILESIWKTASCFMQIRSEKYTTQLSAEFEMGIMDEFLERASSIDLVFP